jgi:predicted secreted hydrolase
VSGRVSRARRRLGSLFGLCGLAGGVPGFSRLSGLSGLSGMGGLAGLGWTAPGAAAGQWDAVLPGTRLEFPRDHGAHPGFRTEWWYVTGWLQRADGREAAFQVTFFRVRTAHPDANPSRFAPTQLMLAHAALALPEHGRLLHGERSGRIASGLAGAEVGDTRVWVGPGADRWRLERDPATDRYRTRLRTADFALDLELAPDGPPLLQGEAGFARRSADTASHYYSRPQLRVAGSLDIAANARRPRETATVGLTGRAWFDHEWFSDLLPPGIAGWDWAGLNLDDGTAVMVYRWRDAEGRQRWRNGTVRGPDGAARTGLAPVFEPLGQWRSPRSGATYPIAMRVSVAGRSLELQPMFDDQELDARSSTGTIYWEGAVSVLEAGRRVGRGHMELTGYAGPVRF